MQGRGVRIRAAVLAAALVVGAAPDGWRWPVEHVVVTHEYQAPAHAYGPGHRGIDLRLDDERMLRAPADGVIAFAGQVAGRGVVTIDHGDGLVTTLEPAVTVLGVGSPVARGDVVAEPGLGGHAAPGDVHFGVRRDGEYVNPRMLLGGVPRAVLLPCC
ncbi:murein hydrolase activator EnvC family protein [Microbacterium terricola]|uniref:murein hydrolase activator EnvC family protein n=1 Tax=Microbacterium terricola TaxID=344163 RepID=UPI00248F843D|nr:M23 family metallopeptidase [Microbacterium terricola]